MGVGDPLEASYPLAGPINAGNWHLVGDGIVLSPVDMQFDVLWRTSNGDQPVVRFRYHFDPPAGYNAVPLDADASGVAIAASAGDLLVLRMTAVQAPAGPAYIPNADGPHTNGRIPSLTLPP